MAEPAKTAPKRGPGRPRQATAVLSQRQWAQEIGVSTERVRQYLALGLPCRPDGQLIRGVAEAWLAANVAGELRQNGAAAVEPPAPEAQDMLTPVGGGASYGEARRLAEIAKANKLLMELEKLRGSLVPADQVIALGYEQARRYRDAWLNWPSRVAALLAARWGADAVRVQVDLEAEVRAHLAGLADITLEAVVDQRGAA